MEYAKPWLTVEEQVDRLIQKGLDVEDRGRAVRVIEAVGYYRVTGYLYPFLEAEEYVDEAGNSKVRILNRYKPGTALEHGESIIDFDRQLRLLVMEGVERIEVAVRMRIGYVLGRLSAFAHEDPACFTQAFTRSDTDGPDPKPSKQAEWLARVKKRCDSSDEQFVAHFREKYDDRMPIWALTELLEMGHLAVLYRGMLQEGAEEVAVAFGAPTKKVMGSWLASLNYVRNVAAHHARLFNRKLQNAPSRPKAGAVALLDHLNAPDLPKGAWGTYNALAVIAYMLRFIDPECSWAARMADLFRAFPESHVLTVESIGVPRDWATLDLWQEWGCASLTDTARDIHEGGSCAGTPFDRG